MGDDHCAARELDQGVLQRTERLDIEVVGRLIEQDQVAALLQGQRQVQPVALTAGEHLGRLLLVGALETEGGEVRTRRHLVLADVDVVQPVGDDLPDALFRIDVLTALVDVGQLDGLADVDDAGVRLLQTDDGLEQGGLTHTVRADDADDAVTRQGERQVLDQDATVEALLQILDLHDLVAKARRGRDLDLLEVQFPVLLGLGGHLLVALQTGLVLGLTCLRGGADPGQLVLQALLQLLVLLAGDLQALGLLLQVGGVVAFVGVQLSAVDLTDPFRDVVEEVTVVCDGQDSTLVVGEVLLQPQDGLGVQVVGGLVEQQQVRLGQQQLGQGDAAALTAGKVGDRRVGRRAAQRLHGLLDLGVDLPGVGGVERLLEDAHLLHELVGVVGRHFLGDGLEALLFLEDFAETLLDVLADGLLLVQRRLLQQDAHGRAGLEEGLAVGGLVHASHDLENGGLAGTVGADDADFGARVKGHRDIVQNDLVADDPSHILHRVDELGHFSPCV